MRSLKYIILMFAIFISSASCNVYYLFGGEVVSYDMNARNEECILSYPDIENSEYLDKLRNDYGLDVLVENIDDDMEKVLTVLHWVSKQWRHHSSNTPSKPDAITILEEARSGERFRCVEYSVVLSTSLLSLGYKSRILFLKTRDVETATSGAGHVAVEVWIQGLGKWVLVDGQFDAMPMLDGVPLNAVELQAAIAENDDIKYKNIDGFHCYLKAINYTNFIADYLYYFDTMLCQRVTFQEEVVYFMGKSYLMLVSLGAKNPGIFQGGDAMDYLIYTNAYKDFYQSPL